MVKASRICWLFYCPKSRYKILPPNSELVESLKIIDEKKSVPIPKHNIDMLLKLGYITSALDGSWIINSKGRSMLNQIKKISQGKGNLTS